MLLTSPSARVWALALWCVDQANSSYAAGETAQTCGNRAQGVVHRLIDAGVISEDDAILALS